MKTILIAIFGMVIYFTGALVGAELIMSEIGSVIYVGVLLVMILHCDGGNHE